MNHAAPAGSTALPVTVIRPGQRVGSFTWREAWQARELMYFLAMRDAKLRYSQTVLGAA